MHVILRALGIYVHFIHDDLSHKHTQSMVVVHSIAKELKAKGQEETEEASAHVIK